MALATSIFEEMQSIVETVFWDTIKHNGVDVKAKIDVDPVVETQNGIYHVDATLVFKKSDFATAPATGDAVVIPSGTNGAGNFRLGEKLAENAINWTFTGNKIG